VRFWVALFFLGWGLPLTAQDDLPYGKGKETLKTRARNATAWTKS
jgi:hypothetical protein